MTRLSNEQTRKRYEAVLRGEIVGERDQRTQTPEEHAESLFEQACNEEVRGQEKDALKLFAAAVRVNPNPRYLRRAARCALNARELAIAYEYAKQAVSMRSKDPSYARVLADVYRAQRKLKEAEALLVQALQWKTENDVLARELKADLDKLRKMRAAEERQLER